MLEKITEYNKATRIPFFSFLTATPLIIFYEISIIFLNHSDITGLRNGADVIFKQLFSLFNIYGFYSIGLLILIILVISYYFYSKENTRLNFRFYYFPLVLLESAIYAVLLYLIFSKIAQFDISLNLNKRLNLILAAGAGVYEEFLFRVVFITGFVFFFNQILRFQRYISLILSIILSSFIFSCFHYIGFHGDTFQLKTFALRFFSGLYLSILYISRGYSVAAYSHAFYDIILIFI
ncbi:MAG: CPBP family intramembrane metalloprotease [Candidatus Marinimicrobia bacterium]|nr:CPBP family intramembrane metalloprotease [Candidatus Neomarinimicrobiota bacterium]